MYQKPQRIAVIAAAAPTALATGGRCCALTITMASRAPANATVGALEYLLLSARPKRSAAAARSAGRRSTTHTSVSSSAAHSKLLVPASIYIVCAFDVAPRNVAIRAAATIAVRAP